MFLFHSDDDDDDRGEAAPLQERPIEKAKPKQKQDQQAKKRVEGDRDNIRAAPVPLVFFPPLLLLSKQIIFYILASCSIET